MAYRETRVHKNRTVVIKEGIIYSDQCLYEIKQHKFFTLQREIYRLFI